MRAARLDWEYKNGQWQEVEEDVQTCAVETTDAARLTDDIVPQIQKVDGITRTLTCPVVGTR